MDLWLVFEVVGTFSGDSTCRGLDFTGLSEEPRVAVGGSPRADCNPSPARVQLHAGYWAGLAPASQGLGEKTAHAIVGAS